MNLGDTSATLEESQDVNKCVYLRLFMLFMTYAWLFKGDDHCVCNARSPQSRSSELSPQSLSWSHTQFPGMHCASSHRNSLSEHDLGSIVDNHSQRDTHIFSMIYYCLHISFFATPRFIFQITGLNWRKSYSGLRWKIWSMALTAVPLVWAVTTVISAVTLPADGDTAVVVTTEISQRVTGHLLCLTKSESSREKLLQHVAN